MSTIKYRRIADLIKPDGVSYGIVQPGEQDPAGVPMLRASDLSATSDSSDSMKVAPDIERKFARTRLLGGELLISLVGTPGVTKVASSALAGFNVARAVGVVRPSEVEPHWLHYAFQTAPVKAQVKESLNTTVQATLNLADLKSIVIPVPAEPTRKAVVKILGAFDDKIASNRRVVAVCDDLRSHLWNRACASDRNERPLSSLARFVNGRAFTKDASGTGRIVIRIAELNSGIGASTVRNDIQVAGEHVAERGDLLLAWSGSLTSARWFREEAIVNQHIFKVIPNSDSEMWAVASAVDSKLADFKEIAKDKATTMGHIRRADLDQPVGWPEVSAEVGEAGQNLWSRALSAEMENEVLARTRDELLPLLMNGRITVEDAEQAAGAVL